MDINKVVITTIPTEYGSKPSPKLGGGTKVKVYSNEAIGTFIIPRGFEPYKETRYAYIGGLVQVFEHSINQHNAPGVRIEDIISFVKKEIGEETKFTTKRPLIY